MEKSYDELVIEFNQQLKFLTRFCYDYDSGFEEAYILIAGVLRTILNDSSNSRGFNSKILNQAQKLSEVCHDRKAFANELAFNNAKRISKSLCDLIENTQQPRITSQSLLLQLKKNQIQFLDSTFPLNRFCSYTINVQHKDGIRYYDLVKQMIYYGKHPYTGLCIKVIGIDENAKIKIAKFDPLFVEHGLEIDYRKKDFSKWWNTIVFDDFSGTQLTRKMLVKLIADKYGYAHVDPSKDSSIERHKDFQSIMLNPYKPDLAKSYQNSPIGTTIRQIAFEVMHTFNSELSALLDLDYLNSQNLAVNNKR